LIFVLVIVFIISAKYQSHKRQYGISMQAILMRIKICNILNDHAIKQIFNAFKLLGWNVNEPYDFHGFEQSNRMQQLIYRALAEGLVSERKAAELSKMEGNEITELKMVKK